jgi:hypothetical protein
MTLTPKFLGGATLGTEATIYTAPAGNTVRIEHIVISNGSTAGTVTVKFRDSSSSTDYELLNGVTIEANGVLELADIILEAGDSIRASAATTTGAKITIFGVENDNS